IDACPPDFVSQIHTWYDAMTTRTSQRFGLQAKIVGSLIALVVAVALPLDSLDLVKRLSVDDRLRKEFVDRSKAYMDERGKLNAASSPANPADLKNQKDGLDQRIQQVEQRINELSGGTGGIVAARPVSLAAYREFIAKNISGLLLSWVLLSL